MNKYETGLSWSITRSTLLNYCEKKYFFQYYGNYIKYFDVDYWLLTLTLKNLKTIQMWSGEILHNIISEYLSIASKQSYNKDIHENIKKKFIIITEKKYIESKNKNYKQFDKYNKFGLSEHFYNKNIDEEFYIILDKILKNFDNFVEGNINKIILSYFNTNNKRFIEGNKPNFEKMKIKIPNIEELKNIVIWAQPDFGVITNNSQYYIYDRKSGKDELKNENNISDQLKTYALKVMINLGVKINEIENINIYCYEYYLTNMKTYGGKIINQDIITIIEKIKKDIQIMKKFIVNENTLKNHPIDYKYFSRTENKNKCNNCTYKKICEELEKYEN